MFAGIITLIDDINSTFIVPTIEEQLTSDSHLVLKEKTDFQYPIESTTTTTKPNTVKAPQNLSTIKPKCKIKDMGNLYHLQDNASTNIPVGQIYINVEDEKEASTLPQQTLPHYINKSLEEMLMELDPNAIEMTKELQSSIMGVVTTNKTSLLWRVQMLLRQAENRLNNQKEGFTQLNDEIVKIVQSLYYMQNSIKIFIVCFNTHRDMVTH